MVLKDIRVWIDSKDLKECNEMLGINWIELELWLQVAWKARFFWIRLGFLQAIFLFLIMWYALYIYIGWNWSWFEEEIIINQCKDYLFLYKIKSYLFWSISIKFLPYQDQFRNFPAFLGYLDLKEERKINFAINYDFIPYFWL